MAAVPEGATLPSQQQSVGGLPSVHANSPETMFGALASGTQDFAEATGKASDMAAQRALQVANLNNKAMSDVAYQGYLNDAGQLEAKFQEDNKNVDPANAQGIYTDYVGKLEQLRQKYRGTLGNMMAQSNFDQDSRRMQGYMIMGGSRTVASGVTSFRNAAFEGQMNTLTARAAASSDPAEQETIKQQIANTAYAHGQDLHLPEDAIKADVLQRTSQVDVSIIDQLQKTDAEAAHAYLQAHKGEITPAHLGALTEQVDQALYMQGSQTIAERAVGGLTVAAGGSPAAAAAHAQNPGPLNAHGLTPSAAAMEAGILQAFPGTRPTSEGRTAAQNATVHGAANSEHMSGNAIDFHIPAGMTGQQFAAQIKEKFPDATVLYEGPGAAHSTAPHVHVQVGGAGAPVTSGGSPASSYEYMQSHAPGIFQQADAEADAYAAKYGLNPALMRSQVEAHLEANMNRGEYIYKQQIAGSQERLTDAIASGGANGEPIGDLSTLFRAYPQAQADYNAMTGADKVHVQAQLRQGANVITPGRLQEWDNIAGMTSQQMLALNPLDPKLDLSTSQRQQLISKQTTLRKQAAKQQEHDVKINGIISNKLVRSALAEAGLTDEKGIVQGDGQEYNVFVGRMLQQEEAWVASHPTHRGPVPDQEVANMASAMLAKRGGEEFNLFNPGSWMNGPQRPPIIPPDRGQALKEDLQNRLGYEPTPEQVGSYYEYRRRQGLEK